MGNAEMLDQTLGVIESFRKRSVIVLGDFYLDEYIHAIPLGLSPEFAVPRLLERAREAVPGAAGNVAANLAGLGCEVFAVGAIGEDGAGQRIAGLLNGLGVNTENLLRSADRVTGTLSRIVSDAPHGGSQHLLRLDQERVPSGSGGIEAEILARLGRLLPRVQGLFCSDYEESVPGTGLLSAVSVHKVASLARASGVRSLGSSRRRAALLAGVDGVIMNRAEAQLLGLSSPQRIETFAAECLERLGLQYLCITLGEEGVFCADRAERVRVPARRSELIDPCGAGDTFAAVFFAAMLSGSSLKEACRIANEGAAVVVGKHGTVPLTNEELSRQLKYGARGGGKLREPAELEALLEGLRSTRRIVFTNGYFDLFHSGHVHFLKKAKELGDILVVGTNSDRSTRENKGEGRPLLSESERIEILAALDVVDFVTVFDELTPINLIRRIRPHVLVKGGNYVEDEVIGSDLVRAHGGTVVIVPHESKTTTVGLMHLIKHASDGLRSTS
jgi:D-beta-D-heptose 7-phosphate kinase/D-beta-D-heptose 1-phosphate adenosyltransferase